MNSGRIYIYRNGFYEYKNSVPILKKEINRNLGDETSGGRVAEVLGYIERSTYTNLQDIKHNYICVNNGLINLDTLKLEKHTPSKFVDFRIPVTYDKSIDSEPIHKFVEQIMSKANSETFQDAVGNILAPHYVTKKLIYLYGPNDSGKSTILNILGRWLTKDNISNLNLNQLGEKFTNAQIYQKRGNISSDVPTVVKGRNYGRIKNFTGGDAVTLQFKHQNPFEYESIAKLFFSSNKIPLIDEDTADDGFYRRWQFIECPHTFEPDDTIISRYSKEENKSAFLAYTLEGVSNLRNNKWRLSHQMDKYQVIEIFQKGKIKEDGFLMWLNSNCKPSINNYEFAKKLYINCREWCIKYRYDYPINVVQFGIAMHGQNIIPVTDYRPTIKDKQQLAYRGIKLI